MRLLEHKGSWMFPLVLILVERDKTCSGGSGGSKSGVDIFNIRMLKMHLNIKLPAEFV